LGGRACGYSGFIVFFLSLSPLLLFGIGHLPSLTAILVISLGEFLLPRCHFLVFMSYSAWLPRSCPRILFSIIRYYYRISSFSRAVRDCLCLTLTRWHHLIRVTSSSLAMSHFPRFQFREVRATSVICRRSASPLALRLRVTFDGFVPP